MIRLEGGIEGERQRDRAGTLYFTLGLCSVQNVISCLDKNKGGGERGSVAVHLRICDEGPGRWGGGVGAGGGYRDIDE